MAVFSGALVYTSADSDPFTSPVPFDSEAYDVGDWHDGGVNPARLTVPADVSFVRVMSSQTVTNAGYNGNILKNGAVFFGASHFKGMDSGGGPAAGATAIIAVSAGDYFETSNSTTSFNLQAGSWLGVEVIDPATKMALVKKATTQLLPHGTTTVIDWDDEERDTDGFHDTVTNNSRLTVPSGVGLVRVSAHLSHDNTTTSAASDFRMSLIKNGASFPGCAVKDQYRYSSGNWMGCVSAIVAVSAGDYFECNAYMTVGHTLQADERCWFQIEEVPPGTKYALANKTATQAIVANTPAAVELAEVADTDGFYDAGAPTRLTVPSGVSKVRLSFNLSGASASAKLIGEVRKNGAAAPGLPAQVSTTASTDNVNGLGAWVDVTPGDYFELWATSTVGQTLPASDSAWLCIEDMTAAAPVAHEGSAAFTGTGTLSGEATRVRHASATMTASGAVSGEAARHRFASAALTGEGELSGEGAFGDPWACRPGTPAAWTCP